MTEPTPGPPTTSGMVAGSMILGAMLLFALLGAGAGAALGASGLVAVAGMLVGLFVGVWLVYRRFRDL